MCECGSARPGDVPARAVQIGDPAGDPIEVDVKIAAGGLWLGRAWVTGTGVADFVAKRFIIPVEV